MSTSRESLLASEGFVCVTTMSVGLPHHVWLVDIEIEFNRTLGLAEETVLGLIAAGIGSPAEIGEVMGLQGDPMRRDVLVYLLLAEALVRTPTGLRLTSRGERMLHEASTRERKSEQVKLRCDPYRGEFSWGFDEREYLTERELREAGLRALPAPPELRESDIEACYREVQQLVDRHGFPFDDLAKKSEQPRREVLRVRPLRSSVAWREAELEVWHHAERGLFEWRLLRAGAEEPEVSERLAELQAEGQTIIPLEDLPPARDASIETGAEATVHALVEQTAASGQHAVLQAHEHRDALREAIEEAREELIVVSPWLRTAAVDAELISWLEHALDRNRSLRIVIGYGIERNSRRKKDLAADDQEAAIARLRRVGARAKGRLRVVEIGNTHEKLVVCDTRYVIVGSFNFLSFNPQPGKGVRRETSYRITDSAAVREIRQGIAGVLDRASRR